MPNLVHLESIVQEFDLRWPQPAVAGKQSFGSQPEIAVRSWHEYQWSVTRAWLFDFAGKNSHKDRK